MSHPLAKNPWQLIFFFIYLSCNRSKDPVTGLMVYFSCRSLDLSSPQQVFSFPNVGSFLHALAYTPGKRDQQLLVSVPKDTGKVGWKKLPKFLNGSRWI